TVEAGNSPYTYSGTGSYIQVAVGINTTAVLNHSSGTLTDTGSLYLGSNATGNGTYNLSGSGVLSADFEQIGDAGRGTFNQSGGSNSTSGILYLGLNSASGNGVYNLSGGTLSVGSNLTI